MSRFWLTRFYDGFIVNVTVVMIPGDLFLTYNCVLSIDRPLIHQKRFIMLLKTKCLVPLASTGCHNHSSINGTSQCFCLQTLVTFFFGYFDAEYIFFQIIKIIIFQGERTDISAKKQALQQA